MIVPRYMLGEIVRGETDEVHIEQEPPAVGTIQAVQGEVGKLAACSIEVLDTWPHRDGGHVVRFRRAIKEEIRLLSRSSITTQPYTSSSEFAASEEPEAIDRDTLARYALENEQSTLSELHNREAERREQWTLDQRMKRAMHLAQVNGIDVNSELRVLERKLDLIERKVGARAA